MKSFQTIQEAYDWITKVAAAMHEKPKFPESPPASTSKRARHTYLVKGQGTGFDPSDDSGAKSNSKLKPCFHCVKNFENFFKVEPSDDTKSQLKHLYPRDCPLMSSAPPKADKDIDTSGKSKFSRKRGREDVDESKDSGNNKKKTPSKGSPLKGRKGAGKGSSASKNKKRNVKVSFGTPDNE